jgi:hypothetical protein
MVDRSRQAAEAARVQLRDRWPDPVVQIAEGDPHEHVLRAAQEWGAELVVLGRSADGERSAALGSVARLTAHHLECSVLLVDRAPESAGEIVLGVDGSANAREAVRLLSLLGFAPALRLLALGVVNTSWRRSLDLEALPLVVRSAVDEMAARQLADTRAALARTTVTLAGRMVVETDAAV